MKKNNCLILLSTYNGEKFLKEQIDSLLKQEEIDVDIYIRDDGSKDKTVEIIKQFKEKFPNRIEFYQGQNLGYAKSFWDLVRTSPKYDYYAFCDQDDIWMPNKIINAINKFKECDNEKPLLYTSNVICVDEKLNILNKCAFDGKILNEYEAFQKSILPGCTYVFNYTLKKLMVEYKGYMESHDWITNIIATVFGKVIYDTNSYIFYRIHMTNAIGLESKYKNFLKRVKRFFKPNNNTRSRVAKDFLKTFSGKINKELECDIKNLAYYRENYIDKIRLLFNKRFKGVIFKIYVLINKV